jgi:hypothetical protein
MFEQSFEEFRNQKLKELGILELFENEKSMQEREDSSTWSFDDDYNLDGFEDELEMFDFKRNKNNNDIEDIFGFNFLEENFEPTHFNKNICLLKSRQLQKKRKNQRKLKLEKHLTKYLKKEAENTKVVKNITKNKKTKKTKKTIIKKNEKKKKEHFFVDKQLNKLSGNKCQEKKSRRKVSFIKAKTMKGQFIKKSHRSTILSRKQYINMRKDEKGTISLDLVKRHKYEPYLNISFLGKSVHKTNGERHSFISSFLFFFFYFFFFSLFFFFLTFLNKTLFLGIQTSYKKQRFSKT